ncbi:cbb3-type cytochrome oxidase assembly protein CcoS [Arcobacteraceae bacterium]|nr:cbb3-type cytochrome oxidase assembly protein CcoS [Arcobacteraceae bacterium]
MNNILWVELVVGMIVSFTLLGIFIWGVKQGQFDDGKKMMNGLLNDSTEELQSAIRRDEKVKELKANKKEKLKNS